MYFIQTEYMLTLSYINTFRLNNEPSSLLLNRMISCLHAIIPARHDSPVISKPEAHAHL